MGLTQSGSDINKEGLVYWNKRDDKKAFELFKISALKGDKYGQFNLGVCYVDGRGVEKDTKEALHWFIASATQGHAISQNNVGYCHQHSIGVERDMKEAIRWYNLSVEQGDDCGQYNLGLCYENGEGVERDMKKALRLYRLSANQKHTKAMNKLSELADSPSQFPEYTCVICKTNKSIMVFKKCGHLISCYSCSTQLNKCPMCREEIDEKIRVYM